MNIIAFWDKRYMDILLDRERKEPKSRASDLVGASRTRLSLYIKNYFKAKFHLWEFDDL